MDADAEGKLARLGRAESNESSSGLDRERGVTLAGHPRRIDADDFVAHY